MNKQDTAVRELLEKLLKIECLRTVISTDNSPNLLKSNQYIAQADSLLQALEPDDWNQTAASYDGTKPLGLG
jgi:hypothetical protein